MKTPELSSFYISCPLGFEPEVMTEVRQAWPVLIDLNGQPTEFACPELQEDRGGISLQAPFHLGLQLNFFLKGAHRILWRVQEFRVKDFPKLYQKIKAIPWENILQNAEIEWVVAAQKSRLNNEKRITEACADAIVRLEPGVKPQKIFVRISEDLCTVSLDTSGEHLHKRGWAPLKGEAPLRENFAALLVQKMMGAKTLADLQSLTLVDPFSGSGTLLFEAMALRMPVFHRDFSFFHWKKCPKIFQSPVWMRNYKLNIEKTFAAAVGFDVDAKMVSAAQENLKTLQEKTQREWPVTFQQEDLFTGDKTNLPQPLWVISNPPYGERLQIESEEVAGFQKMLERIATKFSPEKIALLLPKKLEVQRLKAPKGFKKSSEIFFQNGGLEVVFQIYGRVN